MIFPSLFSYCYLGKVELQNSFVIVFPTFKNYV